MGGRERKRFATSEFFKTHFAFELLDRIQIDLCIGVGGIDKISGVVYK